MMDQSITYTKVDSAELAGLRARVHQLESIINDGPAIAFIWELSEGWPVMFVSESITFFEYQPAEFFDGELDYAEIIHPDDLERISAEVEYNINNNVHSFYQRYRVVTKTGRIRWVSDWTRVKCDSDGKACQAQGIILDITDNVLLEDRARKYLMSSGNLFIALDHEGIITEVNEMTEAVIESVRDDLIGTNWIERFVPDNQRQAVWDDFNNLLSKTDWSGVSEFENDIISTTGKHHTIHWYYTVDSDSDGKFINLIAFGANVTGQRQAEARANHMANMPLQDPNPVLRVDKNGDIILTNSAANTLIEELADNIEDLLEWTQLIKLAKNTTVDANHTLRVSNRNFLFSIVPIHDGGYTNLYGADVTDHEKMTIALSNTLKKTIYALSSVLEARDPYTAGHEERVAQIAVKIAKEMGLDEQRLNGLELAATIHDIGKIKIPTEILSKPTRLSKAEYEIIKTHPEAGASFIRDIDFEWPIADIVEQHHERMDGSGYPKGLFGKDILLEARILGVADTLEAAASHRPYRAGLGMTSAIEIIKNGSGTHFDPDVVNACLKLIETGEIEL